MRQFRITIATLTILVATSARAQVYTGLKGLLHAPSADMEEVGTARIGGYYMDNHLVPSGGFFLYKGEKYNSAAFSVSLTPFRWIEIAYAFTLLKAKHEGHDSPAYNEKDRYFSVKLQPLKEGKYWPSIALGSNDPIGSRGKDGGSMYFSNFFVAATKHFTPGRHNIGVHAAYRHFRREYNAKWNGIVGGITYNPSFAPNLRGIVEYTGDGVNVGADCLLWRHLFLQATLQNGKYFSGGACYQVNLF